MSVLQMVPISLGRHARPETTAGIPRPFTTLTCHKPHTLTNEQGPPPTHPLSSVGAHTLAALRKEVTIFKRRQHLLQALQVIIIENGSVDFIYPCFFFTRTYCICACYAKETSFDFIELFLAMPCIWMPIAASQMCCVYIVQSCVMQMKGKV